MNTSNPNSYFNQAIELARSEGYDFYSEHLAEHYLNPNLWKALGKVPSSHRPLTYWSMENAEGRVTLLDDWQNYAHTFNDLILTGQSTEAFWKELLTSKE